MICSSLEQINTENGTVVTLGNFDGVHRGHTRLLERTAALGRELGAQSVVFTFEPHPLLVTGRDLHLIAPSAEKDRLVLSTGVDVLFHADFRRYREMGAEDFVRRVFVEKLHARAAVIGVNNRFGRKAEGDAELLRRLGAEYGFSVHVVPLVYEDGLLCSSSTIRSLVAAGDIKEANLLLGREFTVDGTVAVGNRIGRTIGFPTANIVPEKHILVPKNGVYATCLTVDGKTYQGITNVGKNPTVGNDRLTVETNILDFEGDIYGKLIRVSFLDKLREERRFPSLDVLKAQLTADKSFRKKLK